MKNREFRTLIATVTLMAMTAGNLAAAPIYVNAAAVPVTTVSSNSNEKTEKVENAVKSEKDGKTETKENENRSEAAKDTEIIAAAEVKLRKDETVYAKIDGNGSVKSITVSDQLKNISGDVQIKDVSNLKDIVNVKGDETFSQKDGNLIWNADHSDICYQGTTDQQLPVGVRITYELDGKDITPEELEGKSGHLMIRYTYENKSGESHEKMTPFLMATGLLLDGESFANVTVKNGKLISDGEREIAIGLGIPGLNDMLGAEELDIPDYFEVEADVTDYKAAVGITVATNSVFQELETDNLDSMDDLKNSMEKLQDAANELVDGSGQLKEGLDTLLSSSGPLTEGIDRLAAGSKTLKDGTGSLQEGASALASGSSELAAGTGQLLAGAKNAQTGAEELSKGLNTASEQVSNVLLPGAAQLDTGVGQMQASLGAQMPSLCEGVAALDQGISQVADGAAALKSGVDQAADGAAAISSGLSQVGSGMEQLNRGIDQAADQTQSLAEGAAVLQNYFTQAANSATANAINDSWDEIGSLQNLVDSGLISDEEALNTVNEIIASLRAEQNERDSATGTDANMAEVASSVANGAAALNGAMNTGDASTGTPSLRATAQSLDNALNGDGTNSGLVSAAASLSGVMNSGNPENGVPSIRGAASSIHAALNTGDSENGVSAIREGASALNAAVNDPEEGLAAQINAGISQLKEGTARLKNGIDGEEGLACGLSLLSDGATALAGGNAQLAWGLESADAGVRSVFAGAGELADGAGRLDAGAAALADGIGTLKSGSSALIDGVEQLDEGAEKLNGGMIQFNEEGIEKLVSVFDGNLDELLDKLNDMLDASKDYRNFSGIDDDMDGEVKFIFISEK